MKSLIIIFTGEKMDSIVELTHHCYYRSDKLTERALYVYLTRLSKIHIIGYLMASSSLGFNEPQI